jgi:type I restriction enzyme M protein
VDKSAIRDTISEHPEFAAFITATATHFTEWREKTAALLKTLGAGCHPKQVIVELSEDLLGHYQGQNLIDAYDIYQHLMDYWADSMQDDLYLIAADGWKAETYRIIEKDKKGKETDKGWACDLIPKPLIVAQYFTLLPESRQRSTSWRRSWKVSQRSSRSWRRSTAARRVRLLSSTR